MSNFVELEGPYGQPLYVRPDKVSGIEYPTDLDGVIEKQIRILVVEGARMAMLDTPKNLKKLRRNVVRRRG